MLICFLLCCQASRRRLRAASDAVVLVEFERWLVCVEPQELARQLSQGAFGKRRDSSEVRAGGGTAPAVSFDLFRALGEPSRHGLYNAQKPFHFCRHRAPPSINARLRSRATC